jgi:hypothetical protein
LLIAPPQADDFFTLLAAALVIERVWYWELKNFLKRQRL